MTENKDIERAESGSPQVTEPVPLKPKCPFPDCGMPYIPEKGKVDACDRHREFVKDWIFCAAHIKVQQVPVQTQSKIIIPGFKPPPISRIIKGNYQS